MLPLLIQPLLSHLPLYILHSILIHPFNGHDLQEVLHNRHSITFSHIVGIVHTYKRFHSNYITHTETLHAFPQRCSKAQVQWNLADLSIRLLYILFTNTLQIASGCCFPFGCLHVVVYYIPWITCQRNVARPVQAISQRQTEEFHVYWSFCLVSNNCDSFIHSVYFR